MHGVTDLNDHPPNPSEENSALVGTLATYLSFLAPVLGAVALLYSYIATLGGVCCGLLPIFGLGVAVLAGATSVAAVSLGYLASDDQRLDETSRSEARRGLQRSWIGLALSVLASFVQCTPILLASAVWAVSNLGP